MNGIVDKLHPFFLSAEDTLGLALQVVPVVSNAFPDDKLIVQMLADTNTSAEDLQDAINRSRECVFTHSMAQKDGSRYKAYIALRDYIHSWTLREDVQS